MPPKSKWELEDEVKSAAASRGKAGKQGSGAAGIVFSSEGVRCSVVLNTSPAMSTGARGKGGRKRRQGMVP